MIKAGPKSAVTKKLYQNPDPVAWFEKVTGTDMYEWQRTELRMLAGTERPRQAYIEVARKCGKSRLAAAVILYEACNKQARHIFCVADSERNLNSVLMREIRDIVGQSPELRDCIHIFKNHIEIPETGSTIETRASNFQATQGINPHLVCFDEVHLQKDDQIINGMAMAGAARDDFLLMMITTPGYDLTSPAHSLYLAVKACTNPDLYGSIYEPTDPDCDITDETLWPESNPILLEDSPRALTHLKSMRADLALVPEHEFRRFRLGLWTATAQAWLPYGLWDSRKSTVQAGPPEPGTKIYIGFDGSVSGDSTALMGCTVDGYLFVIGLWDNPGSKGWKVPRHEVMDAVEMAFGAYNVQVMICDPPYWQREINEWSAKYGARKVLEFPTHVRARVAPATSHFHAGIMEHRLSHDGSLALARHIANCVAKPSPQGDYVTKQSQDSPAKIDAAIAAILAFSMTATAKPTRAPLFIGNLNN